MYVCIYSAFLILYTSHSWRTRCCFDAVRKWKRHDLVPRISCLDAGMKICVKRRFVTYMNQSQNFRKRNRHDFVSEFCVSMLVCVHVRVHLHVRVRVHVHVRVRMRARIFVFVLVFVFTCLCVCVCVWFCVCLCIVFDAECGSVVIFLCIILINFSIMICIIIIFPPKNLQPRTSEQARNTKPSSTLPPKALEMFSAGAFHVDVTPEVHYLSHAHNASLSTLGSCSALQWVAVSCSALQCVAVRYRACQSKD